MGDRCLSPLPRRLGFLYRLLVWLFVCLSAGLRKIYQAFQSFMKLGGGVKNTLHLGAADPDRGVDPGIYFHFL